MLMLRRVVQQGAGRCASASRAASGLRGARLRFPSGGPASATINLTIGEAADGGHALLGPNGSGKSLVSSALCDTTFVSEGERFVGRTGRVSFESHQRLVAKGGHVFDALDKLRTKAAEYLVIRLGLYPILYRDVRSISTGELKKVLLARELAAKPDLLVLDNAFDGLDAPSRGVLKKLISQTIVGFSQILVQAVDAKNTAHTQVLLVTHRPEDEIVPEISHFALLSNTGTMREGGRELLREQEESGDAELLPTSEELKIFFRRETTGEQDALVHARGLSLRRGDFTLLAGLDWTVRAQENWLIAGGNGAGKSTLSSLVGGISRGDEELEGTFEVNTDAVAAVTTELHIRHAASDIVASELFEADAEAARVLRWLLVDDDKILQRKFGELSQGEQKLILLAAALSKRPKLLVLDEVCQGLDERHRRQLLSLLELIGKEKTCSLIYVTHHLDEHLDCISHVIQMAAGKPTFVGRKSDSAPSSAQPPTSPSKEKNKTHSVYR